MAFIIVIIIENSKSIQNIDRCSTYSIAQATVVSMYTSLSCKLLNFKAFRHPSICSVENRCFLIHAICEKVTKENNHYKMF